MNRGWVFLACAAIVSGSSGCSSGPDDNDIPDTAVTDATADMLADSVADGAADSAVDPGASDVPMPDALKDAVTEADVDAGDYVAPIEIRGAFRFDFVATETDMLDRFLTLGTADRRAVAVSGCGEMATVFADRYQDNGFKTSLVLARINLQSPPGIDGLVPRLTLLTRSSATESPSMTTCVAYDGCIPMVFVQTETGWDFAAVDGEGDVSWTTVDTARTWTDVLSSGAQVGRDGKVHLMFRGRPGGGTTQWADAVWNGTVFDVRVFTNPDPAMFAPIDVAFDGDGRPVLAYSKSAGDSLEAWIARWDGTAWQKEQITGVAVSSLGASFAIGSYGREGLAWAAAVESDDKILLSSSLKYTFRDTDNRFRTETVMVENDGYAGNGTRFTGSSPVLTIDGTGRPHIVYSDMAVRMEGDSQTVTQGQLRYAWRRVDRWNHMTILAQDSPGTDSSPYTGFRQVAVSPDGTMAGMAGVAVVPDRFGNVSIDTLGWSIANAD